MELIRGIHNIKPHHVGCVLTIGNFDGVHPGHQIVLSRTIERAKALNLPATVMIFEPQPMELFMGDRAPARLTRLRDKYVYLRQCGVERLLCVNFNKQFAGMSAQSFIDDLLVAKLGVKHLIVGDDFRFGHKRQGDFELLVSQSEQAGFSVMNTDSFRMEGCRVSSTAIRKALAVNDIDAASTLLGRRYSITGRVAHGEKKGRTIGFPTANIALKRKNSPVSGVYAVTVRLDAGTKQGVCNIGFRPTVGGFKSQLEVHLFDFDGDLYGQQLEVMLQTKIRDEQKFSSFEELKQQIARDVLEAKQWFDKNDSQALGLNTK